LSIKTKLIAGVGSLTLAAGALAFVAPAANAAVTTIGGCGDLLALGSAKSTTINPSTGKNYGITDLDNLDGALSSKGVDPATLKGTDLGSCIFTSGQGVPDSNKPPVLWAGGGHDLTKWSTKLFSREFDCDTTDTGDNTEWSPSGALSMSFTDLTTLGKNQSLTAQVTVDGFTDNGGGPSDVVKFHGIVTKGIALGADVSGQTEFDPTIKSKTAVYPNVPGDPNNGAYFGYAYDIGGALGCTTATKGDANILLFNNGSVAGHSQLLGLPVAGISFTKGTA
jgi:hypothetical protein